MLRSIPLRGFDQQMAGLVVKEMKNKGVKFLNRCIPSSLEKSKNGKILVRWEAAQNSEKDSSGSGHEVFDTVLFAVGRRAVTDNLALDKAGIEVDADSGKIIAHNEQTNVPHIYAVGDVLFVSNIFTIFPPYFDITKV
jgi:thioredoxin reductase (NADPH)